MAKVSTPDLQQSVCKRLEYWESHEGYWTSEKFIKQLEKEVQISEVKYPKSEQWKHVWVFDSSSCHTARADDALDVNRMNVNPGGKQPKMRDTVWAGKVQKLTYSLGIPKELRVVLERH